MKKTLKIIGNVLMWIFVVLALVIMIGAIVGTVQKGKDGKGIPSIFGRNLISVQSDSMSPTFKKGYMIFGRDCKNSKEKMDLKPGTVITYFADLNNDGKKQELNSHRIIDVVNSNGESVLKDVANGNYEFIDPEYPNKAIVYYKTQGDNKETNKVPDKDPVIYSDVVSFWNDGDGKVWGLGSVTDFLQSKWGFFFVIVLPCAAFFIFELISLVKILMENKQKKLIASGAVLDEEEIKRKAIEEYIRKQEAEKGEVSDNPALSDSDKKDGSEKEEDN